MLYTPKDKINYDATALLFGVYHSYYTGSIVLSALHAVRVCNLVEMLPICGFVYPNQSVVWAPLRFPLRLL